MVLDTRAVWHWFDAGTASNSLSSLKELIAVQPLRLLDAIGWHDS